MLCLSIQIYIYIVQEAVNSMLRRMETRMYQLVVVDQSEYPHNHNITSYGNGTFQVLLQTKLIIDFFNLSY